MVMGIAVAVAAAAVAVAAAVEAAAVGLQEWIIDTDLINYMFKYHHLLML